MESVTHKSISLFLSLSNAQSPPPPLSRGGPAGGGGGGGGGGAQIRGRRGKRREYSLLASMSVPGTIRLAEREREREIAGGDEAFRNED